MNYVLAVIMIFVIGVLCGQKWWPINQMWECTAQTQPSVLGKTVRCTQWTFNDEATKEAPQ